ncbi:MAG: PEP-CTERM sorting domain-containing protein [Oceanipulchritudo sp.]
MFNKSIHVLGLCGLLTASTTFGQAIFSTDRLGYTGTALRYDSLSDAQDGVSETDSVSFQDRDASIYFEDGQWNVAMGSWWYTTDSDGRLGWGNTNGNTGVGFMQLYDNDFSSVDASSMVFDGWDGTYWRDAILSVEGTNAGSDDYSRLSVYDNVNDGGIYHSYSLDLEVGGLEGTETSPGWIEAGNHPTSVNGSFTGIFELTEDQDSPDNQGFYAVTLDFNMDNWAWENRDDLTYPATGFSDSYFAATPVPEPSTIALFAMGGLGAFLGVRRRLRAKRAKN